MEINVRKFIFKLFNVDSLLHEANIRGQEEERAKQERRGREYNKYDLSIGEQVIVIGNSPSTKNGDILVATVVGHTTCGDKEIPVLEDVNGHQFMSMGVLIPFYQDRFDALKKLTWWERWNIFSGWPSSLDEQSAKNIEEGRPAWDGGDVK